MILRLNSHIKDLGVVVELLGTACSQSKLIAAMFGQFIKKAVQSSLCLGVYAHLETYMDTPFIIADHICAVRDEHRQQIERNGGVALLDGRQTVKSIYLKTECWDNVKSQEECGTHISDAWIKTRSFPFGLERLPWEWAIYRNCLEWSVMDEANMQG